MEQLNQYPRGYMARAASAAPLLLEAGQVTVEQSPYDASIEMLYKMYMGRAINPDRWDFNRRVITRCSQLFGDFREWLVIQVARNDNIYGLNLEFLHDTVQYIRTGQRDMPVATWQELLLEYPDRHPGTSSIARLDAFQLSNPKEFDNFIGMWCSHPGGLADMLCTARALFGLAKKPLLTLPM
jgi:hypothetical protein